MNEWMNKKRSYVLKLNVLGEKKKNGSAIRMQRTWIGMDVVRLVEFLDLKVSSLIITNRLSVTE